MENRNEKVLSYSLTQLLNSRRSMITYSVEGVKMPKIKKRETSAWIRKVAASHGRKVGEVGYMFVDDEKILEVNNEYLGHDYYTDVITFDYDEGDVINGDIVISLDTVRTNAEQFGKTYDDELASCHHSRHPAPVRHQRQGPGRARNHGGEREQGSRHARRCFDIEVEDVFCVELAGKQSCSILCTAMCSPANPDT